MSKFSESMYGLAECTATGVKYANAYFTPDCGRSFFGVKSATALVYSGRLLPAVEAEGFFDVIVDAASFLSGEGESRP